MTLKVSDLPSVEVVIKENERLKAELKKMRAAGNKSSGLSKLTQQQVEDILKGDDEF